MKHPYPLGGSVQVQEFKKYIFNCHEFTNEEVVAYFTVDDERENHKCVGIHEFTKKWFNCTISRAKKAISVGTNTFGVFPKYTSHLSHYV